MFRIQPFISRDHIIFFGLVLFLFFSQTILAQGKLRPGVLYEPGESFLAPRAGVSATIPDGWTGISPRDTELFLLQAQDKSNGRIYASAAEDTEASIIKRWEEPWVLAPGIQIEKTGQGMRRNGNPASYLTVKGSTQNMQGYAEAICGPHGICVVLVLLTPEKYLEEQRQTLIQLADDLSFSQPKIVDLYDDFNWASYLPGKYFVQYENRPGSKAVNELWLCPDGSFKMKLKRKGLVKDEVGDYKGRTKGRWRIDEDMGQHTTLYLVFDRKPLVAIDARIEDDKIYFNDLRHYAMMYNKCR